MKSTADITREIIKSIIIPLWDQIVSNQDIPVRDIADRIKDSELEKLEIFQFIEFSKEKALAMKISYRCNRKVFYELVGKFLQQLESIGDLGSRYDKKIDAIACEGKNSSYLGNSMEDDIEKIFTLARKAKKEIEEDYARRSEKIKNRKKPKEVVKT